jgi:hypothetical protein
LIFRYGNRNANYIEAIREFPLEEKVKDKILAETSPESLKLS